MPRGHTFALYAALGVEPSATPEELKQQYHKLSLQYHPDRNGGDPEAVKKFQVLNNAFAILRDPEKRRHYDETGDERDREPSEDDVDLSDLMAQFMFGSVPRRRRGPDSLIHIDVTFEEIFVGCTKTLEVERARTCGICQGTGGKANAKKVTCSSCGGEGYRYVSERLVGDVLHSRAVDCPQCRGTGLRYSPSSRCLSCRGIGTVQQTERIDVRIPAGASVDQVIELEGEGDAAFELPPGNLIIRLHLLPHPTFAFAPFGSPDLLSKVELTLSEGLLGFSRIVLIHLDGSALHVDQPGPGKPGYRSLRDGDTVKVRGKGLPAQGGHRQGDLYLSISTSESLEDWLHGLAPEELRTIEALLPPKRPELPDPPSLVQEVQLEQAHLPQFGEYEVEPPERSASSCRIS